MRKLALLCLMIALIFYALSLRPAAAGFAVFGMVFEAAFWIALHRADKKGATDGRGPN